MTTQTKPVLTVGDTTGNYCIEEEIGKGGQSQIFRARNKDTGEFAALKILVEGRCNESPDQLRKRFTREAKVLAQFDTNPRIVTIIQDKLCADPPHIVLELLHGRTLADMLDKIGTIPLIKAVEIAIEILAALCGPHRHNIVHSDLKPANIFLQQIGRVPILRKPCVKVLDFGTTDFEDGRYPPGEGRITAEGRVMGTAAYMSPEQAYGCPGLRPVDRRSDIYVVGVLLYEMITGAPPYDKESPRKTLVCHVNEPVPRFVPSSPHSGTLIERIIRKAMSKRRTKRYTQASHMMFALYSLKHSLDAERRREKQRRASLRT